MRLTFRVVLIFVAALVWPYRATMLASAGFPFVSVAGSANEEFLAVVEVQYDNPGAAVKTIKKITYRVLRRERFVNPNTTLLSGGYWSDSWPWSVAANSRTGMGTLPMISNDGESLVLISINYPYSGGIDALSIYRKDGSQGRLVATLKIKDLWTEQQINPSDNPLHVFSDSSPLWFEGGRLGFSEDNKQLLYKTRWGNTVRVNLSDGKVSQD